MVKSQQITAVPVTAGLVEFEDTVNRPCQVAGTAHSGLDASSACAPKELLGHSYSIDSHSQATMHAPSASGRQLSQSTEALPAAAAPASTPAPAAAPAPEPPQMIIPPANVTVVRTAEELRQATLRGAVDIEIRAHLDLRSLELVANPVLPVQGLQSGPRRPKMALLYASPPLRSIRGNCPDVRPEAALGVPPFPDLLPLKPQQCLLIVGESWLLVNSGMVWIDNIYLKLIRSRVRQFLTFITAGDDRAMNPAIKRSTVYVTSSTIQGQHRGNAQALDADFTGVSLYVDDCIFTDWSGDRSITAISFQSVAHIRNSVFRNMRLTVELVDVSFEGAVHFQDVLLANVTLEHGAVVSTTLNDYRDATGFDISYYAEDDANYDVGVKPVPIGERGVFREDFRIVNETMSDCLYLLRNDNQLPQPGCPAESIAARSRIVERSVFSTGATEAGGGDGGGVVSGLGIPFDAYGPEQSYMYGSGPAFGQALPGQAVEYSYDVDYQAFNDPQLRFEALLVQEDDAWLTAMQKELPARPPSADWPPAGALPPPPPPRERSSLLPDPVTSSPTAAAAILGPLDLAAPVKTQPGSSGNDRGSLWFLAILLVVPVLVWLWIKNRSELTHCCACWRSDSSDQGAKAGSASRQNEESPTQRTHTPIEIVQDEGNPAPADTHARAAPVGGGYNRPPSSDLDIADDANYVLPAHLSLFAKPLSANLSEGECEPGNTVVFAPYTIESAHATSMSRPDADTGGDGSLGEATPCPPQVVQCGGPRSRCSGDVGADAQVEAAHDTSATKFETNAATSSAAHHQYRHNMKGLDVQRSEAESASQQGGAVRALAPAPDVTQRATDVANRSEAVRRLQRQLDRFSPADLFLGQFKMLGRHQRHRGGQAVVQFAARKDRVEFAVKFFLDRAAFLTEAALYAAAFPHVRRAVSDTIAALADAPTSVTSTKAAVPVAEAVSQFLPQVEAVFDGTAGGLVDPRGRPLPPCIVMEKGESLQDWSERAAPDLFTVLSVLSNVSQRLADMHAAGYVHRDLKPANVMWLPRQNRWTVIDFGCVARVGEQAPVSFSLAYAAPEVAVAWRGEERSIEALPSLDAWSLGVTAYELLTGAPAFDLMAHGHSGVVAMLAGDQPLPWEGQLSKQLRAKLGVLSRPVLQLLQREPAHRSTLHAFHASCTHIFATTVGTTQS